MLFMYVCMHLVSIYPCLVRHQFMIRVKLPLEIVDIDECANSPCEHGGTCTDEVNGFTCECTPGYTDANCQTGVCVIQKLA